MNPKEYIEYLKDNPQGHWFKRKLYGWGWTPATWQGWAVTVGFIVLLLINGFYFASKTEDGTLQPRDVKIFFGIMILSIILLITIAYKKGEKPKWSWGNPNLIK